MNLPIQSADAAKALARAVCSTDAPQVSDVLAPHPELKARLDDPLPDYAFGGARSHWWAGSFGVLDHDGDLAPFLIERGAFVDVHAASRLGMLERLDELVSANPALVDATLRAHPDVVQTLTDDQRRRLPNAAQHNNTQAVRLMLAAGWPVDTTDHQGATALHWAGWHGNAEMARDILRYRPPLETGDDEHHARPLGWTIHGSLHGWHRKTGDYGATLEALLLAGAIHSAASEDFEGSDAVRDVLRRWTQNPPR